MTPKEKAKELVDKFSDITTGWNFIEAAKECALICVDEILNGSRLYYFEDYSYWKEVKEEINKLN